METLSAPACEQPADVLDGAHAAADGQRHEAALRGALDDVEDGVAVLVAGRDVEEAQLVGAGGVVGGSRLDRIAGVHQVHELDALDDAAVLDIETGNDADLQHLLLDRWRIGDAAEDGGHRQLDAEAAKGDGAYSSDQLRPATVAMIRQPGAAQTHARGSSWEQIR